MVHTGPLQKPDLSYRYNARMNIHEFHIWDIRPKHVDYWYDTLSQILSAPDAHDTPIACLYFLYGVWFTPYAIKRILDLSRQAPPTLRLSSALVLIGCSDEVIRMVQDTVRQLPVHSTFAREIFFFTGDAIAWLEQHQ